MIEGRKMKKMKKKNDESDLHDRAESIQRKKKGWLCMLIENYPIILDWVVDFDRDRHTFQSTRVIKTLSISLISVSCTAVASKADSRFETNELSCSSSAVSVCGQCCAVASAVRHDEITEKWKSRMREKSGYGNEKRRDKTQSRNENDERTWCISNEVFNPCCDYSQEYTERIGKFAL